jgi:hypothetical protein
MVSTSAHGPHAGRSIMLDDTYWHDIHTEFRVFVQKLLRGTTLEIIA